MNGPSRAGNPERPGPLPRAPRTVVSIDSFKQVKIADHRPGRIMPHPRLKHNVYARLRHQEFRISGFSIVTKYENRPERIMVNNGVYVTINWEMRLYIQNINSWIRACRWRA